MSVMQPRLLTYEDYAALPDDGRRYQVLDGELDVTPAPTTLHQKVSIRLSHLLLEHADRNELGLVLAAPVDVVLARHVIVQPDLVFVSTERLSIVTRKCILGAPDLAIEILSPGTKRKDRRKKSRIYAREGVPWYWIADPDERTIDEWELDPDRDAYSLRSRADGASFKPALFSGLTIDITRLFRP